MSTSVTENYSEQGAIDLAANPEERVAHLNDYIVTSATRLGDMNDRILSGEALGPNAHEWILGQVSFVIDNIDRPELSQEDETRSNLLQLLLGLAHMNEQIRQQASPAR